MAAGLWWLGQCYLVGCVVSEQPQALEDEPICWAMWTVGSGQPLVAGPTLFNGQVGERYGVAVTGWHGKWSVGCLKGWLYLAGRVETGQLNGRARRKSSRHPPGSARSHAKSHGISPAQGWKRKRPVPSPPQTQAMASRSSHNHTFSVPLVKSTKMGRLLTLGVQCLWGPF